jgi:hypothetical protein
MSELSSLLGYKLFVFDIRNAKVVMLSITYILHFCFGLIRRVKRGLVFYCQL